MAITGPVCKDVLQPFHMYFCTFFLHITAFLPSTHLSIKPYQSSFVFPATASTSICTHLSTVMLQKWRWRPLLSRGSSQVIT